MGTRGKPMVLILVEQVLADFAAVPLDQLAADWETVMFDDDQLDS